MTNSTRIVYLINRYPEVSHTFIRREIAALEDLGCEILRISLRSPAGEMVDPADLTERSLTRIILGPGALPRLATAMIRELITAPIRFAKAFALALRLARRSERGLLTHLAYLGEACVLKHWSAGASHIHAHFGTNPAAVALLCRVLNGPPFSFTVHGPDEFDAPRALSLVEKSRGAAFVVAISEFTRSQLCRWSDPGDWKKIRVVHCGLDNSYSMTDMPTPSAEDCRRFVCVGRLAEQKGHLVLVEAAAKLSAQGRDFQVVLVGDGPLRGEIERRVAELGLGDKILLVGWRDGAGVRDEILQSRAMVLPSFAEGLPVVLMEALALRRPAISTYIAGIPELIEPGLNGWLVPAGSSEALASAMAECLDTPTDLLAKMGHAGAEKVSELHDVSYEASKLATLLAVQSEVHIKRPGSPVVCEARAEEKIIHT